MSTSYIRSDAGWPEPSRLFVRCLLAATVILWLVHAAGPGLTAPMLPWFNRVVAAIDDSFTIRGSEIAKRHGADIVRFHADLAHPIQIGGGTLYPQTAGTGVSQLQVTVTVGGVLQSCALMLIIILAWPLLSVQAASGPAASQAAVSEQTRTEAALCAREYAARIAISVPLLAVLLLADVPLSVDAELWNLLREQLEPDRAQPLMIWNRFLMGGGGFALALLAAFADIHWAKALCGAAVGVARGSQESGPTSATRTPG